MDILFFVYYMIYVPMSRIGHFSHCNSPFTINGGTKYGNDMTELLIDNYAKISLIFFVGLYSIDTYIYMPQMGLGEIQKYLSSKYDYMLTITCITIIQVSIICFILFYKNRYLKYFDKFKRMGFFRTFIYSIIGLFLMILPIILLFAAI